MADDLHNWMLPGPSGLCLDIAQVARILHTSVKTVRRLIDIGEFPCGQMVAGKLTWTGSDIAAYLHLRGRYRREEGLGQIGTDESV